MISKVFLIKHSRGALGLRLFGLGPKFKPIKGLLKLKNFLDRNTFWARGRQINELRECLANSDVVVSLWDGNEIVGFGRALSDGVYRGVLWDIVIDQNHQKKGYGKIIVNTLLNSRQIKKTKKIYLMTTNKTSFYSQLDFSEVLSQNLLIREI